MTYAVGSALQAAVFQRLQTDTDLLGLVGPAVFDTLPGGTLPDLYVVLGHEEAKDLSSATHGGAVHRFVVSVVAATGGFKNAKDTAAAVSDALVDAGLSLDRGRLVSLRFQRAKARRARAGSARRIDLTFQAIVEDD
ncbi:MAG: DUF3168 domain-containing protein [Paracoccaceae bacterium]|nr:DUF3168 domain-containing protein [Paracoccaceae bacterium]